MPLWVTIVLDGVGIGAQPDAHVYGDDGSDTLGHVCARELPQLPHLEALGLGCIASLEGIEALAQPQASFGKMCEVSAGKDSTTGHWELAGLMLDTPFPTYPNGFPADVVEAFIAQTGCGGVLGNIPASGTAIVEAHGADHEVTGYPIVYTSADSVFQVAAHVDVVPLEQLYAWCQIAREEICVGSHAVGRVIARPFEGQGGAYQRISAKRKDYSLEPPSSPVQAILQAAGVKTVAVGKIADLFAGVGFDVSHKTKSNAEGIQATLEHMQDLGSEHAFLWTNLVDFDQEYGHRNNPSGFARALEAFDAALPQLIAALPADSRLVITADHGNDPTTPSTDHSREYVPLLVIDPAQPIGRDLGIRATFADHAASLAKYFGLAYAGAGTAWETSRHPMT
ncbi:MAG: phosphopentomutase [Rhodothermales bacterium]